MQLQIVSFFWFLICTSEALQCKSCLERYSDHCESEETIDCGDSDGCGAASGFFQQGSERKNFIYKGCRLPIECNSWLRISMNGTYLQSYITCCDGEMCDLDYYIPSDEDEPYNGYECKSCYSEDTEEGCSSTQQQKCRGDETVCMEYKGSHRKQDGEETAVFFAGCGNPLSCENLASFYSFEEIGSGFLLCNFFPLEIPPVMMN
ncbi:phospholipase A2 inhibitor subunit gamma A-like [Rana temporaria]|uniref:phospholipase A2 inhibitor subunit gamma A-like n=1 Tax=Rana temporaria TaxID=8407 RepID=UPI001AADA38C|nr:phospholipase A2 inhibitor subunit gamma A-like [Rana temporaria]